MERGLFCFGAAASWLFWTQQAGSAAPGGTAASTGTANATLVRAISIAAINDLRLGVIAQPDAVGTMTASHGRDSPNQALSAVPPGSTGAR
jgi:hypothetical protein